MYTEPRVADSRGPRQLIVPHWGDGDNRKSHEARETGRPIHSYRRQLALEDPGGSFGDL